MGVEQGLLALIGAADVGAYEIEQSLRFDGSSYMTRTPASNGSLSTWTYSTWIKYGDVAGSIVNTLISTKTTVTPYGQLLIRANQELGFYQRNSGNTDSSWQKYSSNKLRDPSAWYHFLFVLNTGDSTVNNRQRMWINGVEVTSFSSDYKPGSADNSAINSTQEHMIGAYRSSSIAGYMKGYMAETHFVDGTALDPDDFGEYDDNGVWRPKRYTGSYGTNGFYLKFDPSATNGIGHDHSGNGNNFTPTGFTTSGTGTDVMSDTPTTNWCTLNPLDNSGTTQSDGNLVTTKAAAGYESIRATFGMSAGKWYWESTRTSGSGNNLVVGIVDNAVITDYFDRAATGYGYRASDGYKTNNNTGSAYGATYAAGDVIGVAFDADNGDLFFYKNGTVQNSGTAAFTGLTAGPYFPAIAVAGGDVNTVNFGQRAFAYTPPTGFKSLNSSNLPAPTVKDGSDYFNTVLYTGNGTTNHAITGVGFQPDFVWGKRRDGAFSHGLFDSIRGGDKRLVSNLTNAEDTLSEYVKSFDANGFTLGNDANLNFNTASMVAWNWKAGGTGSSNTAGSITSTVSANPTAGFSIVSYTGTGSAATVGHGLGVAAKMIIVKRRTSSSNNWYVYHEELGNTKALSLNTTGAASTANFWNNTSPTSTVFNLGNLGDTNLSSMIAYCFAEVEGYSKFGIYRGNSNSDGPFAFCGFKPRWLMIKSTSAGGWFLFDTERDRYNVSDASLQAELASAESSSYLIDILSNGFKIRTTNTSLNYSVYDYIFAAFAENSFGGFGVSPATAR